MEILLFVAGAVLSFGGSVVANLMFYGKIEKSRAKKETQRAYNKLMNRLVHTTISDINHPLHLLPVEIADRVEDLRYALADVNEKFDLVALVQKAIGQAVDLRKQQEQQYGVNEHVPGELLRAEIGKSYNVQLELTVKEILQPLPLDYPGLAVNQLIHPIRQRTVVRCQLVSAQGIEDGEYTLRYSFDGKQEVRSVRVQSGRLPAAQ